MRHVLERHGNGSVRLVDAPIVEGAVAAAVTASAAMPLDDVGPIGGGGPWRRQALRPSSWLPPAVDLHARPAADFVRAAMGFAADVQVAAGDREASAKSLLSVLALGAKGGTELRLTASGEDAAAAVEALSGCIATLSD